MKKSAIVFLFAAFMSITALAQNVQEGVNNLYAERFQSAQSIFQKLLASNPNNIEATYWLGQTYLAQKDINNAKSVYEKALAANGNAPLVLVGMGEVELMQGNVASARQRFEAAITASKGKKGGDPNVLNAIGKAIADATTEANRANLGDLLDYGIARLNEAAQAAPNNADIFINLGNLYRKKRDGGNAVINYRKAAQINPKLALAPYLIARLYKTQTTWKGGNWDIVLENLNNAITADPKFAPAYLEMYYYYLLSKQDFATAEKYAGQYISNSDPSVENDFLKMQTVFVQNKYDEAINIGKNILQQTNNNPRPRVFRALAYSYLGAKDTATACQYTEQFFTKAPEDEIVGQDYLLHAQSCGKSNPDVIRADITKAVQIDSVLSRQLTLLNEAIEDAKKNNQRVLEAELRLVSYQLRGDKANPTELISFVTVPFYLGGAYQKADSVAKVYAAAAPDSIYGYYWSALALSRIDTSLEQGLAIPSFEKTLEVADKDKVRYKSQGVTAAKYLAAYYNNVKKDRTQALAYTQKGLEFDPTDPNLQSISKALSATPKSSSGGSTKSSTSKSKGK